MECNVLEENIHNQGLHCSLQSQLVVRVHQEQRMLLHGNKAGHLRCPVLAAGKTDELSSDSYKKNCTHKKGFQKLKHLTSFHGVSKQVKVYGHSEKKIFKRICLNWTSGALVLYNNRMGELYLN